MRIFFIFSLLLLIVSGCSKSTAFREFDMDDDRERAISNLRTATIVHEGETKAIVSTIYLNNTMPEIFQGDGEYFVVAIYQKDDTGILLSRVTMNGVMPSEVKKLEEGDRVRALMPIRNEWNSYYLLSYSAENNETLKLSFESGQYGSAVLTYQKDER